MRKTYKLTDLDCAHCAAKMEAAIQKIDGVTEASVSFLTQKLTVEAVSYTHLTLPTNSLV